MTDDRPLHDAESNDLTDGEAVLRYRGVTKDEREAAAVPPRMFPGPAAGAGVSSAAAAGLSGAVAANILDDPWGTEEPDEYAVPGAVTGGAEQNEDRRRTRHAGMALRGSGTRGGRAGAASSAAPPPMMAAGGSGGAAGAPGVVGAPSSTSAMAANVAGGNPLSAVPAAHVGRAASPAAFSPIGSGGGSGVMAAGSEEVDPQLVRDALIASGFHPDEDEVIGADGRILNEDLIDSDGDGVPDAPRTRARTNAAGAGGLIAAGAQPGLPHGAPGGSTAPGLRPPGVAPAPVGSGPGGYTNPTAPPSTASPVPSTGTGTGSTPWQPAPAPGTTWQSGPQAATGSNSTGSTSGGTNWGSGGSGSQGPVSSGPAPAQPTSPSFSQDTPIYSGSGGTDFHVNTSDLRRDASHWSGLSDDAGPMKQQVLSSPDPDAMFGVMKAPVSPYEQAVVTSAEYAEQSGVESLEISTNLRDTASNYDEAEDAAVDGTGRIQQ